jgi:GTP pyrophosphokinase
MAFVLLTIVGGAAGLSLTPATSGFAACRVPSRASTPALGGSVFAVSPTLAALQQATSDIATAPSAPEASSQPALIEMPTYPAPSGCTSELLSAVKYLPPAEVTLVEEALDFAARAHYGQRRKSGEPFIIHPVAVAVILADLRMDVCTIVSGLLHDVVEDTSVSIEELAERFGSSCATIVSGVTDGASNAPGENQRELLLAMSQEWRVVLVKLADRLHNMRTLEHMPRVKQVKKAAETMELLLPLAQRVGISEIEAELQHLCSSYLSPFPSATSLLDRVPGSAAALDALARRKAPPLLEYFLHEDETLSRFDVDTRLSHHRQRWAEHCARSFETA